MGVQHTIWGFVVFLLLTSSLCHGKNVAVQVIGLVHCTDCLKHELNNSSKTFSGINVFIRCKAKEKTAQGNGVVDTSGKFTVTLLSADERTEDEDSVDGCFAKLQSAARLCPIHTAQTASVQLRMQHEHVAIHKQTQIKFSPVTCQSAMFWPLPNITTFFHSPPPSPEQPIEYVPPPSPAAPPAQPPLPPVETLVPPPGPAFPPTLPLPAPEIESPSPQPDDTFTTPSRAPQPAFQIPQSPPSNPPFNSPSQPPVPTHNTPSFPPTTPPIPYPSPESPAPIPPPFSHLPPPFSHHPFPNFPPHHGKEFPHFHFHTDPFPTPPPTGTTKTPPNIKPSPIPRAPPVPKLPRTPTVPRKYFNPPESKVHPPRPS